MCNGYDQNFKNFRDLNLNASMVGVRIYKNMSY